MQVLLFSATFNEKVKDFAQRVAGESNQVSLQAGSSSLLPQHCAVARLRLAVAQHTQLSSWTCQLLDKLQIEALVLLDSCRSLFPKRSCRWMSSSSIMW